MLPGRSVPPPPGFTPTPTSGWPSRMFSRDAKRMSQARTNSLLTPRAAVADVERNIAEVAGAHRLSMG